MKRLLAVFAALVLATAGAVVLRERLDDERDPLLIVHWSNSHLMRDGLLEEMAADFNDADHETAAGQPIEVVVVKCDSVDQVNDLVSRVKGAGRAEDSCSTSGGVPSGNPTIITPQSGDWLVDLNAKAGRQVVDVQAAEHIAETWLGIVTYRDMAACLGWPDEQLGYADIIELSARPEGWQSAGICAETNWGSRPLLAFTNPGTSTTGRNVLVSLYSIAAGKRPAELTTADVQRPDVVQYVSDFQDLVDHYMPGTNPLNTKIRQGRSYGHFFLLPEDNLMSLCRGNETATGPDGDTVRLPPVTDMVMLFPKEGSVLNSNPAAIVDAPWVTAESRDAAEQWIDHLHADGAQRTFAASGFRPTGGSSVQIDAGEFAACGLSATPPTAQIEPGELQPDVLAEIMGSWGRVKNPAIVTFVVDISGSMEGQTLDDVKLGLTDLLDAMVDSNSDGSGDQVGLVTFNGQIRAQLAPAPLAEARFDIGDEINRMEASGNTALYDAIERAISLTDQAPGEPDATRAVVVLSDGAATAGRCLSDLIAMMSTTEQTVELCGLRRDEARTVDGDIPIEEVVGDRLVVEHDNDVQIFFLGFGEADVNIGRLLAEATGAEYQASTSDNLAAVIEGLSGYF